MKMPPARLAWLAAISLLVPFGSARAQSPPGRAARGESPQAVVPGCEAEPGRAAERLHGTVNRGQAFSATTPSGWILRLEPDAQGWLLNVMTKGREAEDLSRLTPPWHFVPNPRAIEGWHFRNADNTGPNDGSVNAPRELREFIFSPAVGREVEYDGSATSDEAVEKVRSFGRGWLFIESYRLTPPRRGERAAFETMTFSACLTSPVETSSAVPVEQTDLPSVTLPPPLARVLGDYERAWQSRDAAALAALFAEDGFVLSDGAPAVRGRAQIEKHYAGAGGPLVLRALAFATDGSLGTIIGAFARQKGQADIGKFTLTLRKGPDDRWLIVSDMDNGNARR